MFFKKDFMVFIYVNLYLHFYINGHFIHFDEFYYFDLKLFNNIAINTLRIENWVKNTILGHQKHIYYRIFMNFFMNSCIFLVFFNFIFQLNLLWFWFENSLLISFKSCSTHKMNSSCYHIYLKVIEKSKI